MERKLVTAVLLALTMMQSTTHAEVISDLPVPGGSDSQVVSTTVTTISSGPRTPPPLPPPVSNQQQERSGAVVINSLSRKSNGTTYRISLSQATVLSRLELQVLKSRLKVHSVKVITERGQALSVRELTNTGVLNSGTVTSSENLNLSDRITAIEIVGESYSAEADIRLIAFSMYSSPQMTYRPVFVENGNGGHSGSGSAEVCSASTRGDNLIKERLDAIALWSRRMDAAPGGSTQESFAAKELDRYVNDVLSILQNNHNQLSLAYMQELFKFYNQKYNSAPSGSRPEAVYAKLARGFSDASVKVMNREMDCTIARMNGSSEQILNMLTGYIAAYNRAPSGSREEDNYRKLIVAAKAKVIPAYEKELERKYNFRQVVAELENFVAKYNAAPSGSISEDVYRQMILKARHRALDILKNQVSSMNAEQKYSLIEEFEGKYRRAPSGSIAEGFARDVLAVVNR
nr:hypothetical protein BdHM001_08670 [Bdellovibrio sp. HM001]